MITDGKPTCLKENGQYYKNSFGLDRKVINKTLQFSEAMPTTKDSNHDIYDCQRPYLQGFCSGVYEVDHGKAYYSGLDGLSSMVLEDFENMKKTITQQTDMDYTSIKTLGELKASGYTPRIG